MNILKLIIKGIDTNKHLAGFAKITENPPIRKTRISLFSTQVLRERESFANFPWNILHSFVLSGFHSFQRFDLPILFLLFRWRVEALVPVNSHRKRPHHPVIECHSSLKINMPMDCWFRAWKKIKMFGHGGDQNLIRWWWLSIVITFCIMRETFTAPSDAFFIHPPSQPACQSISPGSLDIFTLQGHPLELLRNCESSQSLRISANSRSWSSSGHSKR